jgi:hypothetical protein
MGRAAAALAAVLTVAALTAVGSAAAWVAAATNSGNQFVTASSFPNYPTSVTNDGAWAYHREEESPSSASTLTAADSSGNSRPGTFSGTTNGPSTWWAFDENTGTTAGDSSGAANPGTLVNSPSWVTAPVGTGLSFNGSTGYVAGTSRAVHTNASLTVAAWVNASSLAGGDGAAVSQNGSHTYGFTLGLDSTSDKWSFNMTNSDVASPTVVEQYSSAVATVGAWVHLVGVYDTSVSKMYLYVNGNVIGNASKSTSWDATGAVQAGRAYIGDAWSGYFNGKVDDVRIYNRALSATEIANLAQNGPMVQWDFSESSGSTTVDAGSVGDTGTLGSAASFVAGHAGNAISMSNSSNGYVVGATSAVDTSKSFSVAAWVYLNSFGTGVARTAVAQAGTTSSAFILKYDSGGSWAFTAAESDVTSPTVDQVTSISGASTNTWVHLAGVFDASAHTIRLYVNGTSQGTATHAAGSAWNATGALQVGRSRWDGAYADAWYGKVDSVRVYQRALSSTDVTNLKNDTEPASTFTEADMTAGVIGALQGTYQGLSSANGVAFAGNATAYNNTSASNPTTFTLECWFKVSGTAGGELVGFHQTTSGSGVSHDRTLYVDSGGQLTFGTYVSSAQTVRSTSAYNDATWHHAAASLGAAGMKLYVDGTLVASSATTTAGNYSGYWRWGGGDLSSMPNRPTDDYLTGSIDEVAIYSTQLTDTQIRQHYQRNY